MTTKLLLRRAAALGGTSQDLYAYSGRKGAPSFDGQQSLIELGMRCYEGQAAQGDFIVEDPNHDMSGDIFPSAHWLVTWTEDGPGFDAWLFRGRVGQDEGRRGITVIDDEVEWTVQVDDGNIELQGQAFTDPWVRPEETDIQRLVALQLYTLNGSSSTADHFRATCNVTINTSHLAPNLNTVTMPPKKYPAGTQPLEVVKDCADTAGKQFGVVIHHTGGSHLCLLYIVNNDHTTYLSPCKISDTLADWDPLDPSAPVLEPHWEQGSAIIIGMQTLLSGLVGVWGNGENGEFVEYAGVEDQTDYWVEAYHDGDSTTAGQVADRTAGLLEGRRNSNVTNRVSVILQPDQVDLITAGMSIEIKSATNFEDADVYFTKRIAECRFEPRHDGTYWCHLDLERPPLRVAPGRGKVGPLPPVQSEPPPGEIIDWSWSYDTNKKDDQTDTLLSGGNYDTWGNPGGSVWIGVSTSSGYIGYTDSFGEATVSPGTYHFKGDFWNNSATGNPDGIKVFVIGHDAAHAVTVTHTSPFIAEAIHFWDHYEADVTFPAGTTHFGWGTFPYKGHAADNIVLSHGGGSGFTGTPPPPASSGGTGSVGTSPIASPSDHEHPAQTAAVTPIEDAGGFFEEFFVEGALQELASTGTWKRAVRVATTAAGTLASSFENGDTIDGVTLATGDRILIKDQASGAENGIYVVAASGAPTRASDFDGDNEVVGSMVMVTNGTANADKAFQMTTNAPVTVGSTTMTFTEFGASVSDHGSLTGLADDDHPQYLQTTDLETAGHFEVVVSGTAPPVAVTNEAEDDWVYGFVSG